MPSNDSNLSEFPSDYLRGKEPLTYSVSDQNAVSANARDRALLKALQELIVPLICQTVNGNDIDQISFGPEAGKLIAVLREFISGVVHFQPEEKIQRKLSLTLSEEDIAQETALHSSLDDMGEVDDIDGDDEESLSGTDSDDEAKGLKEKELQPLSHDMVFRALHDHVFNRMPIRLLCFEHLGYSLQISLVERSTIYARIEATMRSQLDEAELIPRIPMFGSIEDSSKVIERLMSKYARYAILSHTWLRTASGEVTYGDWNRGRLDAKDAGYQKLVNFCITSWRDYGLAFGWMDTLCINKDSSSELDESIRSMYNWYKRASVCIVHLADTGALSNMHTDPWFTRGWTLQELLAPRVIKFYNNNWKQFVDESDNDKHDEKITKQIENATTITKDELNPSYMEFVVPISRKMELAATRRVTREEDTAYSLMGIFNVSIATAYGEGADRAFSRLLQEILATSVDVMDIFNWAGPDTYSNNVQPHNSHILPGSPQNYVYRSDVASYKMWNPPMEPMTLTHIGLRVPIILMPAISVADPAFESDPIGDYNATVNVSPLHITDSHLRTTHHLLDKQIFRPDSRRVLNSNSNRARVTFAVLSFTGETASTIRISKTCFAMALRCTEDVGKVSASSDINVIETDKPIVFNLDKKTLTGDIDTDKLGRYYRVKTDELPKHGMQLVTLYL